ncbi:acyltransferase [Skermanella aerolata]|uniref:Acyltransferase n=1 Tax=Skermanella aerolata TaxID=393310 RepID=A0A512DUU0_9PROT|nr:acyltransferase [Skermanella aerolata]GEO40243.1 acyltransferase [Skermanella aerolata]
MKFTIISIQILRAFAALLVVFHHARYQIPEFEVFFHGEIWQFGQAGVDIFFVISGFIMWVTTHKRRTTPLRFMTNRIVRIVPLYWLLTLTVAGACLLAPHLFRGVMLTPEHVVKSLFFIPSFYPGLPTRIWPLLLPGWTLNYEMVFYLVFAVALLLPRRLMIPLIASLFVTAVAAGFIFDFDSAAGLFYTESLILEFVAGMMLGHFWLHGRLKMPTLPALAVIPVAVAALVVLAPFEAPETRMLVWGVPAILIVTASLSLDLRGRFASNRFLKLMGDASYSIYLTHILTLGVVRTVWSRLGLVERELDSACVYLVASIAVSVVVGITVYYLVELPLLRFFKRSKAAQPARASLPAAASTR